jgi:hypothetical protein
VNVAVTVNVPDFLDFLDENEMGRCEPSISGRDWLGEEIEFKRSGTVTGTFTFTGKKRAEEERSDPVSLSLSLSLP